MINFIVPADASWWLDGAWVWESFKTTPKKKIKNKKTDSEW